MRLFCERVNYHPRELAKVCHSIVRVSSSTEPGKVDAVKRIVDVVDDTIDHDAASVVHVLRVYEIICHQSSGE